MLLFKNTYEKLILLSFKLINNFFYLFYIILYYFLKNSKLIARRHDALELDHRAQL